MQNQINIVLKELCTQALTQGVCSGISAAVSFGCDQQRRHGFFCGGTTRYDILQRPVKEHTLFDIASLTKPLCTALCTLTLIDCGVLDLSTDCRRFLGMQPALGNNPLHVGHILNHCTGLPAYHPYFAEYAPQPSPAHAATLIARIAAEPLINSPGKLSLYSDFGFIVLGQVIQKISQSGLDQFFSQHIARPLDLDREICFRPCSGADSVTRERLDIAATENCPWRGTVIQGEAHDEHCWLMDGVAGHAGLFATARAVLRLCESLFDCWQKKESHPAISRATLQTALEWQSSCGSWRLGFDSPSPKQSSSGRYFSPRSVGHLGFTGTSFWMDPERELIVVLLTNRVHPSRDNLKIRAFRPYFHDLLWEKLGGWAGTNKITPRHQ